MAKEDLIKQMADSLIEKLVKKTLVPNTPQKAFIVFCEESTDILRSKITKVLPNHEIINLNEITEKITQISNSKALVLVAPSIELAAKITGLQSDNPIANLAIKTLFANKRVIIVAVGALATTTTLRIGLRKAVEDLRCKLVEMGVEFADISELVQLLDLSAIDTQHLKEAKENSKVETNNLSENITHLISSQPTTKPLLTNLNPESSKKSASYPLPLIVHPISQHPSQTKLTSKDELSDFVDFLQTKECTMEKAKPCDRCDMCNTLGF